MNSSTQNFLIVGVLVWLVIIFALAGAFWRLDRRAERRYQRYISAKKINQFRTGAWMADCKGRR